MELVVRVAGWPPAKSEAQSLFAADHPHADQISSLLKAAAAALGDSPGWEPRETSPIALDMWLFVPEGTDPQSDATNYLGGVADVLQAQRTNVDLTHLGDLSHVSLYANDRQLIEITYRVLPAESVGYELRIATR